MHPQLDAIAGEYAAAEERLHRLSADTPDEWWARRADPARWSIAECVVHLNLASRAYVPLIRSGIAQARAAGGPAPGRYRRDPIGWFLWRTAGPPVRHRVRTTAPFVPRAEAPRAEVVGEFTRLQAEQLALVREADGLPLSRVRVTSPFDSRIRYNLYSCLSIQPPHQHRHLWQAEQVLDALRYRR